MHKAFFRIVGDPYLARAKTYMRIQNNVHDLWRDFQLQMGAYRYYGGFEIHGLGFSLLRAKGWGRPNAEGRSIPREGTPDREILSRLPRKPHPREVFPSREFPYSIGWVSQGDLGSGSSPLFEAEIHQVGGDYYAILPDIYQYTKDLKDYDPNVEIIGGVDQWTFPSGLSRVSREEYELERATFNFYKMKGEDLHGYGY